MGKFDKEIEAARGMLAESQREYEEAVIEMADSPAAVRDLVLNNYYSKVAEAQNMIDIFTSNND